MGKKAGLRLVWLAPVLLALATAGCATNQKKYEEEIRRQAELIDNLTSENNRLQGEADGLRNSLSTAQQQSSSAQSELAELRRKMESEGVGRARPEPGQFGARATERAGGVRFTLESKVLFSLGKSELTEEGQRALRRVANAIKSDFPGKYIRIEGHTDSVPVKSVPGKTNLELSNERAEAVWHFLVDQCGIDPKKVYTAGFAQYRPVATNRTEPGRQMNRRVEIVVLDE
jgi:chemotaxis protein MotB